MKSSIKQSIGPAVFGTIALIVIGTIIGLGVRDHANRREVERNRYIDCVQQAAQNGVTDAARVHTVCGNPD